MKFDDIKHSGIYRPEIFLDMDGVLADFFSAQAKIAGVPTYRDISAEQNERTLNQMVGTDFFARLDKMPDADALVNLSIKIFGHYNICSSPLRGDFDNSDKNKRIWIKNNLKPLPKHIFITPNKKVHAKQPDGTPNILVDDRGDNITSWEAAGGVAIKYQADEDSLDVVVQGLKRAFDIIRGKIKHEPQQLKSRDRSKGNLIAKADDIKENDEEHSQALKQTGFWGRRAAGCVFMAMDTGRVCVAHRSSAVEQPGTWGTWGGAIDGNEDPAVAVRREVREEAGYTGAMRLIPMYVFEHSSGFKYFNFLALVPHEFKPMLNWETAGSDWFDLDSLPSPLHPGLVKLLADSASMATMQKYAAMANKKITDEDTMRAKDFERDGPVDPEIHSVLIKARTAHPHAASDAEALAAYALDREEEEHKRIAALNNREHARIDNVNKREDADIDRLENLERDLDHHVQSIEHRLRSLEQKR